MSESGATDVATSTDSVVVDDESFSERLNHICLGVAFVITAILAARRMKNNVTNAVAGSGAETTVVTAFYSLILWTSVLRAVWFLLFEFGMATYTPIAVYAWTTPYSEWLSAILSQVILTAGSTLLFAIFILILVYWADILKKYFHPGARRALPMTTFVRLVAILVTLQVLNVVGFLLRMYTSEAMILVNAIILAAVSLTCVVEITIFSHRFRTVLQTLGAINQVSTDSQVTRIVWITVTGNVFFCTRALLEIAFTTVLLVYWRANGTVQYVFSHAAWNVYTFTKFWSEWAILALMLYILQSRFSRKDAESLDQTTATTGTAEEKQPLNV